LRIAFFNPQGNFDPKDSYWTFHPDFGGQLVYVKEVASAMALLGIKVDIFTRRIKDEKWPEFSSKMDFYPGIDNLRIIRIDFGGEKFLPKEKLWPYLKDYVKGIKEFYEEEKNMPTFVTSHYGDGGISAAMFSNITKIPYSFTAHSLGAQKMDKLHVNEKNIEKMDERYNFSTRINAERIAMKYSSFNVVSTSMERYEQYSHKLYKGWINVEDDKKFKVVPPGVNLKIFNVNAAPKDEKIKQRLENVIKEYSTSSRIDLPLVILASRIDQKKNHISALKAYLKNEWLKEHANFLIVVRGMKNVYEEYKNLEKDEMNVLDEIVKLIQKEKAKDRVFFVEANGQDELASLYRVASKKGSVFCNPALYEPFGLSIVEAMACGLPVVATKNGGPSEILKNSKQEYGILVEPENPNEMAQAFEQLLKNEEMYSTLEKKGLERVKEKYTWNATAQGYLKAINEVGNFSSQPEIPSFFWEGKLAPTLDFNSF
jgi:sucrose-phosphate synthase